jgi:diacylglycerol kinase (ATP)
MLLRRALRPHRRVDIVVNRCASRLGEDSRLVSAIHESAGGSSGFAHVHETRSLAELDDAMRAIAERGTDCVLFAGGDGSSLAGTSALVRAFGDALPSVAFAPGGTVNTVARNWGYRGDAVVYTRRLIEETLTGTARRSRRPTLRVRDDCGGDRVGFIFGAGLIARFFDAYYDAPTQGTRKAAELVARIFVGTFTGGRLARRVLTPSPATLVVDGQELPSRAWSLIAASVVHDLGLHMHLLYRAGENPNAFHLVASALPPRRLAPQVGRVVMGRGLTGPAHVDTLAEKLEATLGDGSSLSSYVLDGDRIAARRVTVTPGPVVAYESAS